MNILNFIYKKVDFFIMEASKNRIVKFIFVSLVSFYLFLLLKAWMAIFVSVFNILYNGIYVFNIYLKLLNIFPDSYLIPCLIILAISFIIYKTANKRGAVKFFFFYAVFVYFFLILPQERNIEYENSHRIGYELVAKLNEHHAKYGEYPEKIDSVFQSIPYKQGFQKKDAHYYPVNKSNPRYSKNNKNYFSLIISNDSWGWCDLWYRFDRNVFEYSDSE